MLILSRADVRGALTMAAAIAATREAFAQLGAGTAVVPQRAALEIPAHEALTLVMPAYLKQTPALGCKLVSVHPHNPPHGLPLVHALVVLIDEATGQPLAAIEGSDLTALRTGAASGLATDLLARPDARVLACFGAGAQAETQVEAICEVRTIERVWVKSRSQAGAQGFADRLRGKGRVPADIRVAATAREAMAEADIVCTATTSSTPVFDGRDLRIGTHVNAIGSYNLGMREIDTEALKRARIVVDSRDACRAEAGELVFAWSSGEIAGPESWTELGEILKGQGLGRQSAEEITLFKSVGNAAQDMAAAWRAYQVAKDCGLGLEVDLDS